MNEEYSAELEGQFNQKFLSEKDALDLLEEHGRLTSGERDNVARLRNMQEQGFAAALARRRKPEKRADDIALIREFLRYGARAALNTGAQRGGDFLLNSLHGRWAEAVVLSMNIDGLKLVHFGPTGAAMPGDEDYRDIRTAFEEIQRLEGKRPDLVAFATQDWAALPAELKERVATWPKRLLDRTDQELLRTVVCGGEVKSSAWHYDKRRQAGGGPLSVTVKEEEIPFLVGWSGRVGRPIVVFQVFFDEVYCMSFDRILEVISRSPEEQFLYAEGDYKLDDQTGARDDKAKERKVYHHVYTGRDDFRHRCAKVVFPDRSVGVVAPLSDGKVVPHIRFEPTQAIDVNSEAVWTEISYGHAAGAKLRPRLT